MFGVVRFGCGFVCFVLMLCLWFAVFCYALFCYVMLGYVLFVVGVDCCGLVVGLFVSC